MRDQTGLAGETTTLAFNLNKPQDFIHPELALYLRNFPPNHHSDAFYPRFICPPELALYLFAPELALYLFALELALYLFVPELALYLFAPELLLGVELGLYLVFRLIY
jgi:hypothetical protein